MDTSYFISMVCDNSALSLGCFEKLALFKC
jgi:hypothetical protein